MAEVVAWWAHTDDLTPAHGDWLDDRERERLARLQQRADRERFTLGTALVRSLVADLDGADPASVTLDRGCLRCGQQHGPVAAAGRPWSVTVSHSGSFAVAAATPSKPAAPSRPAEPARRIGIDLETRCPLEWRELLPRVLAPAERAPDGRQEFVRLWVRKEAVLKTAGYGLRTPMTSVSLSDHGQAQVVDDPIPVRVVDLDLGPLHAAGLDDPAAAALAVQADSVELRWQRAHL